MWLGPGGWENGAESIRSPTNRASALFAFLTGYQEGHVMSLAED
jgi:hypothetical protein